MMKKFVIKIFPPVKTPEQINKLNKLFEEIAHRQAERKGITVEQLLAQYKDTEPLFYKAAREIGERKGISAEQVLADYMKALRNPPYPAPGK